MAVAPNILEQYGLNIKETTNKGKGLFTERPIKEGDVILIEKPLVSCQFSWNKQYNYTACDNCMRSLETAQNMARRLTSNFELELPYLESCCTMMKQQKLIHKCPRCQEQFCCEECFVEAEEKYHKLFCLGNDNRNLEHPINKLEESWKRMHYPPETATVMLIVKMIAVVEQSLQHDDISNGYNQFFCKIKDTTNKMAHKLLGEQFKEQLEILYDQMKTAIPIRKFQKLKNVDDLKALFGLVGMNGQGIGTSSLSTYIHSIDAMTMHDDERKHIDEFIDKLYDDIAEVSGQFLNCEGSGLYTYQSRANHSCQPNAEVTFPDNNNTLVLVALDDVCVDEEICICYLDECQTSRSRHSRQKILRENYLFNCTCSRCELESGELSQTSSDNESDSDPDEDQRAEN